MVHYMMAFIVKKYVKIIVSCIVLICCGNISLAKELLFYADIARFQSPEGKTYLEVHLSIGGSTVYYNPLANGKFKTSVEVIYLISQQGETQNIVWGDKFLLTNENIIDTTTSVESRFFMDTRRVKLAPGNYQLTIELTDNFAPGKRDYKATRNFSIAQDTISQPVFSDLLWVNSFFPTGSKSTQYTRGNIDILPFVTNGAFLDMDSLKFYIELYTKDIEEPYYYAISILQAANSARIENFTRKTRPQKPQKVNQLIQAFNIKELPSQYYILEVEAVTNDGRTLATKRTRFYVYRSADNQTLPDFSQKYDQLYAHPEESLNVYLQALRFISTPTEINFVNSLQTFSQKKNYFVHFWQKRHQANTPEGYEWKDYLAKIKYANEHFKSALRPGYQTDRGRVLLTYGAPNDIQSFPSQTDKYPYQIWSYNKLGVQSNVIFVFYDRDLTTNEYVQLHSTKFGEFTNPNWRSQLLFQTNGSMGGYDMENYNNNPNLKDHFNDDQIFINNRDNPR